MDKNHGDEVRWMKVFDMVTMEEVSSVIQLCFCIFSYDHLLRFVYGLKFDLLSIPTRVLISMGEFLVVDRMYRSYIVLLIR